MTPWLKFHRAAAGALSCGARAHPLMAGLASFRPEAKRVAKHEDHVFFKKNCGVISQPEMDAADCASAITHVTHARTRPFVRI